MEDSNKNATANKLPKLLAAFSGATCLVVLVLWTALSGEDYAVTSELANSGSSNNHIAMESTAAVQEKTVGSEWKWDNFSQPSTAVDSEVNESDKVFDVPFIYHSLQRVRLDEQGNVIVDHEALTALDETLNFSGLQLDAAQMEELKTLIRIGLRGRAGEQTAEIVEDYYRYLQAEKEFNQLAKTPGAEVDVQAAYEELVALRELYLGPEVAKKLFAQRDQDARYMLESMMLARNESLSAEERRARQEQLSAEFNAQTPVIDRWEQRYQIFQDAEAAVMSSALSDEEKQQQLEELLKQHFSADELPAVRRYRERR
jgi:hypothetical protein